MIRNFLRTVRERPMVWVLLCVAAVAAAVYFLCPREPENYRAKYAGVDLESNVGGVVRENTYGRYLEEHPDAPSPDAQVVLDLHSTQELQGADFEIHSGQQVLKTREESCVTWVFTVEEAGFYNIRVDYYQEDSRSIDAERAVYINGVLPFQNAGFIGFTRFWTDGGQVRQDNQGNDIRPSQVEVFQRGTVLLSDTTTGYEVEPYKFYFSKGSNTLTAPPA